MFVGISIVLSIIFFVSYYFFKQSINSFCKKSYSTILLIIFLILSAVVFLLAIYKILDRDELEHIHTIWYIKNHYTPYTDFFQNHNPLFWYVSIPLFVIFGSSIQVIIAFRILMFIITILIAILIYKIAKKTTGLKEIGLFSIIILFSVVLFISKSIEIRPDVLHLLFELMSVYYFIDYFQHNRSKSIILVGLYTSISFLFLQKTIFLLFSYSLIGIYYLFKRKISIKALFYLVAAFLLPLLVFFVYLLISKSFNDYILTSWILNMKMLGSFSPFKHFGESFHINGLFWILSVISIIYIFLTKDNSELKIVTFIGVIFLLSLFVVKLPNLHYYLPIIPFLCIADAYFLKTIFEKIRINETWRIIIFILIILRPLYYLQPKNIEKNYEQLQKINFVIRNSEESDCMYDGFISYNLFRYDLYYFWFSLKPNRCLDTYNSITNNKYSDYDIVKLIKSKKPRFISDYLVDIAESGLDKLYVKTEYEGLYIRKD